MLIITEKDIENRKSSIKASMNYYTRRMKSKKIHEQYEHTFYNGCESLLQALENIKHSLFHLYLLDTEKHIPLIKQTKGKIEKIFLESKLHQNDLIAEARGIIRSA